MKRLNYLFAAALAPMALSACSTTDAIAETQGSTGSDEDSESDPSNITLTTASTTASTTVSTTDTDASSSTTDPTIGPEESSSSSTDPSGSSGSSSSGGGCTDADECIEDEDCPNPGATCTGCVCFDDPNAVCPKGWGEGTFADCRTDNTVCDASEVCVGGPGLGICTQVDACETACDCPAPPKGFDEQVTCGPVLSNNMTDDCYISCEEGEECPTDMSCVGGRFCIYADARETFGDCFNLGGVCPDTANSGSPGFCITNPVPSTGTEFDGGFCTAGPCDDAADCGTASSGTAVVTCANITDDSPGNECFLDCTAGGATCPDGMLCHPDTGSCYWEALLPHYGACINEVGGCAGPGGVCLSNGGAMPATLSFCASDCAVANDCPDSTFPGGNPTPDCVDIAGGDRCVLSCAGGETCPTGMNCIGNSFCSFPA